MTFKNTKIKIETPKLQTMSLMKGLKSLPKQHWDQLNRKKLRVAQKVKFKSSKVTFE